MTKPQKAAAAPSNLVDTVGTECRKLVEALSSRGLGRYVELPQIAVMGDTSSGKSSLLSSLSGIEFPRDADICTRCPTRVRLFHTDAGPTTIEVTIQWKASDKGRQYRASVNALARVADAIREAQSKIVDADTESSVYEDIVDVQVSGPDVYDLTLIDLPGFVQTVGVNESADMPEAINNIVKPYLKNENCIILAIVPADVNFRNSTIMKLATKFDPHTVRTMPVITKADKVGRGEERNVCDFLQNKASKTHFKHGLHIVKLRSQEDTNDGVSIDSSLEDEERFFSSHKIGIPGKTWKSLIEDSGLHGVRSLRQRISNMFLELTKKTTPTIIKNIQEQLQESERRLKSLGRVHETASSRRTAFDSLSSFAEQFLRTPLDDDALYPRTVESQLSVAKQTFKAKLENSRLCQMQNHHDEWVATLVEDVQRRQSSMPILFPSAEHFAEIVETHVTKEWNDAAQWYCNEVDQILRASVDVILEGCVEVKEPGRRGIKAMFKQKLCDDLDEAAVVARDKVAYQVALESTPSTQNEELTAQFFQGQKKKLEQYIIGAMLVTQPPPAMGDVQNWQCNFCEELHAKMVNDGLPKHVAEELYAALVAYASIAVNRFADLVPAAVDAAVVHKFLKLRWSKTGVTDDMLLAAYQDDASVVSERQRFTTKVTKLREAMTIVQEFQ